MYCVYWIRLPEHTDISSAGYVGITKNLEARLHSHKKNKRKTILTDAAKKYSWDRLIVDEIHTDLTMQEALSIEAQLRPTARIGWNCQRGGELGVESDWYNIEENKQRHSKATSAATKAGIAAKDTTEARAKRARDNWIKNRSSYDGISKGSKNPRALLNEEQVYKIKYDLLDKHSVKEIADMFGVRKHVISWIKSGKNWSHI